MAVIKVPFPLSVNHYYGYNRFNAKPFVTPKGKEYRAAVLDAVLAQAAQYKANVRLRVTVILHRNTKKSYDVDNCMKALLDALTQAKVWVDDALIDELHIYRGGVVETACATIEIEAMDDVAD